MLTKIDKTDLSILKILQKNGKITNVQLSHEIGLSPAPTLERVRKLENNGVIESYHALVNESKLGLSIKTFILLTLTHHKKDDIKSFIEEIDRIEEVVECYHVTGQGDFLLKVISKDIAAYERLILDKLTSFDGLGHIQSFMVLSCIKDTKLLPMDY